MMIVRVLGVLGVLGVLEAGKSEIELMIEKQEFGLPSFCTLLVEKQLNPFTTVSLAKLGPVTRGRPHLLRQEEDSEFRVRAVCGLEESAFIHVPPQDKERRRVGISVSSSREKNNIAETRKIWKEFFGVVSLLLFFCELFIL
jgi:hypothetical protein